MSDIKISQFPQIVGPITGNEFVPLVIANENFKAALSQLGIPFTVTGVTPGSYGGSNQVPGLTVNSYGQITAITNVPIEFDAGDITTGIVALARGGTGSGTASGARVNLLPSYVGNAGKALAVNSGATDVEWISLAGAGTVTSIDVSGGTTGLTTSGGPVTAAGTITIGGTLAVTNGGTGATSAVNALASLGAYPASNPNGYTSNTGTVTSVAGTGTVNGITLTGTVTTSGSLTLGGTLSGVSLTSQVSGTLPIANGGTGATTDATARTSLGAAASGANTDITSIALTSGTVINAPAAGTDIVNKTYADSISAGINFHQSVRLASTTTLAAYTYNNGSSGVGATITANANGALSLDSVAVATNDRVMIKNEVSGNAPYNGIYVVTQTGSGAAPFILTRSTDYNTSGSGVNQINQGDFFLVTAGASQANTSWVQQTPLPITVGTTALTFTQFGAPITYSAGTGLTLAGTVFSITNSGVTANTYGSASSVPVVAINAQGQVTSATSTTIAIAGSQITSGSVAVAQGGTGATTLTGVVIGNGTSAFTTVTAPSGAIVGTTDTQNLTSKTLTTGNTLNAGTSISDTGTIAATSPGFRGLPQNAQTASYTLALTDAGKHISITTGGVIVPANGSVAFPIGSTIVIYNDSSSSQTISITTDTMYLAGSATTGSRTLAQRGLATLVKVASTTWAISGAGVS